MVVPPLFSTVSAVTELFVTLAVAWFFWRGMKHADYRFGIMWTAVAYETAFNITYMVSRLFVHEEGVTHTHEPWVTWFVAFHGSLSLLMFIGLVWLVAWTHKAVRAGDPNPLIRRRGLSTVFLVLWGISVATGELIYAFYWTDVIGPGSG